MADSDFPTMTDGRKAPRQPIVKWWNRLSASLPIPLTWLEDDIKVNGYSTEWKIDSTGEALGGFFGSSTRAGTLSAQLDDVSLPIPLPGHVISIQKYSTTNWYAVKSSSAPFKGKEQVRLSLELQRLVNPLFTGLLSEDEGDTFRLTKSIATGGTTTLAAAPVNTRSGATLLCELAALSTALPAGVTINATSGVISFVHASLVAGTYEIDVTCTDTLANKSTNKGGCRLILTVTA